MHYLRSVAVLLFCLTCVDAQSQALDQKFLLQDGDRNNTQSICNRQYDAAQYWPTRASDKSFLSSLDRLVSGIHDDFNDFDDIRFIATPKGVQGITPSIEQQSSGKWKCKRGSLEAPMFLGKEYRVSTPVYATLPAKCYEGLGSAFTPLPSRRYMHAPECTSRIVGYRTRRRLLKEEGCKKGGKCLVLYKDSIEGKASRQVIAVSAESLRSIFPYSEREEYIFTGRALGGELWTHLGPASLHCKTTSGDAEVRRGLYESCLRSRAIGWE